MRSPHCLYPLATKSPVRDAFYDLLWKTMEGQGGWKTGENGGKGKAKGKGKATEKTVQVFTQINARISQLCATFVFISAFLFFVFRPRFTFFTVLGENAENSLLMENSNYNNLPARLAFFVPTPVARWAFLHFSFALFIG